ncbi:MAG: SPOR domain-containing protein, partial [Pseudomonadales bacterium]
MVSEDSAYNSSRSVDDNYIYLIQAGSFKTQAQAEKLLVELTLLGLEPKIDKSRNASGNLWYRVRLGPFEN